MIDLDHLDEIAKNVTQGPLRVDAPRCNSVQIFTPNDLEHPGVKHWVATFYEPKINDVAFFVDARRALPLLVAVARAAAKLRDRIHSGQIGVYGDSDVNALDAALRPFQPAEPSS